MNLKSMAILAVMLMSVSCSKLESSKSHTPKAAKKTASPEVLQAKSDPLAAEASDASEPAEVVTTAILTKDQAPQSPVQAPSCNSPTQAKGCGGQGGTTDATHSSGFSLEQILGQSLPDKTLVLTVDDGPTDYTVELADFLHDHGIKATFFQIGNNVIGRTDILSHLVSKGHLVANHTMNHEHLPEIQNPAASILETHNLIKGFVTHNQFFFRAPYGEWNEQVRTKVNAVSDLRKYVGPIRWDIGDALTDKYSADWACWDQNLTPAQCAEGYLREIRDRGRGIILMHDLYKQSVDMAKIFIPQALSEGYHFVTLSEVPAIKTMLSE